jgi:hypothetical protein
LKSIPLQKWSLKAYMPGFSLCIDASDSRATLP